MVEYNPKKKPSVLPALVTALFYAFALITIIGGLVYFFTYTDEINMPPNVILPIEKPVVLNAGIETNTENINVVHNHPGLSAIPAIEFEPSQPFANHHSSKSFEPNINCPPFPVKGYPKPYSMLKIIENWNPDDTNIPERHYDPFCHFDYSNKTQLEYAFNYRTAEVPFIAYNIPEVNEVVRKWNDPNYLTKFLGNTRYRTETSDTNHFMYWSNGSKKFKSSTEGKGWKPPTDIVQVTYAEWLKFAVDNQNKSMDDREHQYFRVSSESKHQLLFKELPFFYPQKSLFIVDPGGQRGIHCRFGMRSVIAEAHFDGGRNSIVLFGGMRRYILTHPDQCVNMHMLPKRHPSGRHSDVDWSKPDIEKFPNFAKVMGNEVIMTPGHYLYLPQDWIHYIISLNVNYQCNTRSGFVNKYHHHITECGF